MSAAPAPALPAPPNWLHDLLFKASGRIESKWPLKHAKVKFTWRRVTHLATGEVREDCPKRTYRARVEFFPFVVKVYSRAGVELCRSIQGKPFDIDPTFWQLDGDDE